MKAFQSWRGSLQAVALATVAVGMIAVGNVAARQEAPGRAGSPGPRMRGPMPFAQLNLSDEQKTRIQGIFQKHREAEQATMEQARQARAALRQAIFASSTPDAAQVEQLTNQLADLEGQLLKARTAMDVEVASVLTDAQRQKMAAMPERGPRRGRRF
jgi:Spy/CpxP family protein refolding chaperone